MALTSKNSPISARLKNLKQLQLRKGDFQASLNRKGAVGVNYKNFSGGYQGGNINAAYQVNPNFSVKGFHGKGGSGGSMMFNKSF